MIDPVVTKILTTTFIYAVCGSLIGVVGRLWNRKQPGPSLDQVAAIGALVGAAFGAFFGIFKSMQG